MTAAQTLSHQLAEPNLIAADMGGTSFDVSIVHNGRIRLVTQGEVADCPVRLPMVEIRTIGAGGGSLASVDEAGRLHVGPQSAGAIPGPVCYRRGGSRPAVTDANAVLGRLDPDYFLGGAMTLDSDGATRALQQQIAQPLGLGTETAGEGMVRVATAKMAAAIRLSLFEKGLDPQDFVLLAFGGAGGLHAVETAAELGVQRVIFPRDPGTLSAWGMLFADIAHDLVRSYLTPARPPALTTLNAIARELYQEGQMLLTQDGIEAARRDFRLVLDMRYPGQAYEILVEYEGAAGSDIDEAALDRTIHEFHALHEAQYAHSDILVIPEIVTLRLTAIGRLGKPLQRPWESPGDAAPKNRRRLFLDGDWRQIPVFERACLHPDSVLTGPALIEENHSTLLLPSGWRLTLTTGGDLLAAKIPGET